MEALSPALLALFRERPLVGALLAAHAVALLLWLAGAALRQKKLRTASVWVLAAALAVNTAFIVDRWVQAGRAPFKTLYETMLLYPWCVAAVTLL